MKFKNSIKDQLEVSHISILTTFSVIWTLRSLTTHPPTDLSLKITFERESIKDGCLPVIIVYDI